MSVYSMSSGQQIPPWLQEQLAKMQQAQQNLQSIHAQKQQLDLEKLESEKALEELNKAKDDETVYKHAGSILIKSNKTELIAEIEERKELESKINQMIKSPTAGASSSSSPSQTQPSK